MKLDTDWRKNIAKESMREIRKHLISDLGDVRFEEIIAALLRALLKKKESVNHLRFFLTDICRSATAEGYLSNNVSERLKEPSKVVKPAVPKRQSHWSNMLRFGRC